MDKIKKLGQDLKEGWNKLDRSKRIRLVLVLLALTVVVFGTTLWLQKVDYGVLFSDLDPADAGQITQDLESRGVTYELTDGGRTILIDEQYIDQYRIDLAVEGMLPESSAGFEIFDNTSMMATDDDRQIMYQRAVQGELERAISSLSTVESAKVMLSIPEDSVFQNPEYQKEATASVVLDTRGALGAQSVNGIASLVSGAVEHLPMENIQIVDSKGNLLSRHLQGAGNAFASDIVSQRQAIQRDYEYEMEQKILSLLAPVYGVENVQISVFAELNFDAEELESTTYSNKDDASVLSEQESVSGSGELVQGVQGGTLDDNAGAVMEENDGEDNSSYNRTTNYELDTVRQKLVSAPGSPTNMTASVVIKGNRIDTVNETDLIETAMGGMGVASVQFVSDIEGGPALITPNGEIGEKALAFIEEYWMYLAGLLIILFILMMSIRRSSKRKAEEFDFLDDEEEEDIGPAQQDLEQDLARREKEIKDTAQNKIDQKEEEVRKYAKEYPELASEMIKIWINQKKG